MSYARNSHMQGGFFQDDCRHPFDKNKYNYNSSNNYRNRSWDWNSNLPRNFNHGHEFVGQFGDYNRGYPHSQPNCAPSFKRRKFSATTCGENGRHHLPSNMHYSAAPRDSSDFVPPIHHLPSNMHYSAAPRDSSDFVPPIHHLPSNMHYSAAPRDSSNFVPPPIRSNAESSVSVRNKRDRSQLEDDEPVFISRDDIERYSPSRRDGIDALHETHLRYSYCAFIQSLGLQLELPQTTIGTAMVLCHRFFVRRSHACHDRYLIATAALFLAAKSEETPRPLNNVLRASCEIFHKQDITFLSYLLPVDWFEQYRERVTEAEQMILTTLNFELNVQHPYAPLTSVLNKLGLSQTILVNLALELVSEGVFTRLACSPIMIISWQFDVLCSWKVLFLYLKFNC